MRGLLFLLPLTLLNQELSTENFMSGDCRARSRCLDILLRVKTSSHSVGQACKHVLHIVIGVDRGQKRHHFFQRFGAQVGGFDRVFSFVAQLG